MEGQLWPAERSLLYKTIIDLKPKIALEIGTWKGGGSTYQIASALKEIGEGILITCEPDIEMYKAAFDLYKSVLKDDFPVMLENDYSHNIILKMIEYNHIPDFVLMDGPEDPNVCLNDLKSLENIMKPNSIVAFHDWDLGIRADNLISTKSAFVRPYIEQSTKWKLKYYLTAPESVGFAAYTKL